MTLTVSSSFQTWPSLKKTVLEINQEIHTHARFCHRIITKFSI